MAWLTGWRRRKKITVPAGTVAELLSYFPMRYSVVNDADMGAHAQADGYDMRFTKSDGESPAAYGREAWAIAGGLANGEFHLQTTSLSAVADNVFYVYYDPLTPSGDSSDFATMLTSANYVFFNIGTVADKTGIHTLTDNGTGDVAGKIDRGRDFEATESDYIGCGYNAATDFKGAGQSFTVSAWAKPESVTQGTVVGRVQLVSSVYNIQWYLLALTTNATWGFYVLDTVTFQGAIAAANTQAVGGWCHIVGEADAGTLRIYHNGGASGSTDTYGTLKDIGTTPVEMGVTTRTDSPVYFDGILDQVTVRNVASGAAWIAAECANQSSPATFYTVGAEETEASYPFAAPWAQSPYALPFAA